MNETGLTNGGRFIYPGQQVTQMRLMTETQARVIAPITPADTGRREGGKTELTVMSEELTFVFYTLKLTVFMKKKIDSL